MPCNNPSNVSLPFCLHAASRLDSLVQSQARELSALRQQIKERCGLGLSYRRQLEELSRAFQELLQASEVDLFQGDVLRGQLDKSLGILERLEGRLDRGVLFLDKCFVLLKGFCRW